MKEYNFIPETQRVMLHGRKYIRYAQCTKSSSLVWQTKPFVLFEVWKQYSALTSAILMQSAGPSLISANILWSHSFSSFISYVTSGDL